MEMLFSVRANNSRTIPSSGLLMSVRVVLCILLLLVVVQGVRAAETYTLVTKWGSEGTGDGQFKEPTGVAVDSSGNVYVADYLNNRIQKFSSTGAFLTKWGSTGSDDGQFKQPMGVAVDSSGNVYIVEYNNNRIQKFSSTGTFLTKWGTSGSGDGQFDGPVGIAIDSSGNVYVSDVYNRRIQKFSSTGAFLTRWGTSGSGDGQFNYPSDVAVDLSSNVYVADRGNNRIQKFSSTGAFLTKWGTSGSGDGQFNYPNGVAVDSSGNVYVADGDNNRIQKFSSTGAFLTKWGTPGSGDGQFWGSRWVAVDSSGNVYVPDQSTIRIQKFALQISTPTPTPTPTPTATTIPTTVPTTVPTTIATTASAQETFAATTKGTPGPTTVATTAPGTAAPTSVPTVTPTPAKNLFITITPIKDKYYGEKLTITGSTSIPVGNPILLEITSSKQTQTGGLSGSMTGTNKVLAGIGGTNLFTFEVDAVTFTPDEYTVKVSGNDGTIASTSLFNVLAGTRPGSSGTAKITVPPPGETPQVSTLPVTTQARVPSPGIDLAGYAGIIIVVVIIVVIAGAGIYVMKARKESRHLRVPEPAKKSTTKISSTQKSPSRPPSPQKTGDTPFIQPGTPKQLPAELSDRYTEFELIGKGGFARVFKAKRKDGQYVALKIPISVDAATGKSFIAELQNWTKLDHPNIVRVFDYNIMPLPYFEMELCDGSLADVKKPMDCEEAAWIVFHICEGLKFAHARSIAHRDLKPQNILLKDDIPKISDWGLSKIISESSSTSSGSFTPYYAAPEQMNNKPKDERTDIWQMGVILYELATGTLPFKGDSIVEVAVNISTKPYTRPSELNPATREIEPIIKLCLEKDPDKRFQSVTALQRSLGIYLRQNYAELFKESVSTNDIRRSAYYVGDLIIVNLIIRDLAAAYKYSTDLEQYAKGDAKALAHEFCDQLHIRIENNVNDVPDELIKRAEFVVHKVLMGFGNRG